MNKSCMKKLSDPKPVPAWRPASRSTIVDVARLADVNIATVSRVLGKPEVVRASTRAKVEKAIRVLSYCPNLYARALSTRRTGAIAYFIRGAAALSTPYHSQIIERVEVALEAESRNILIVAGASPGVLPPKILSVMADAFIFHGWELSPDCMKAIAQRKCPTVFFESDLMMGTRSVNYGFPSVRLDWKKVGYLLTCDLIRAGRRKIAFIDVGPSLSHSTVYRGYLAALKDFSVVHDTGLALSIGEGEPVGYELFERNRQACRALLKLGRNAFDAVIAGGDFDAVAFLTELRAHKLRVPEDVAVCAINDALSCQCMEPQITAAWFDTDKIAAAITRQLHRAEGNVSGSSSEIVLEPEIRRRGSTPHPNDPPK
jgi:LacI family transcriptional regulator